MSTTKLLDAILAGDVPLVRHLLDREPEGAASTVTADRLIEDLHWLYDGDTPLHLAAVALEEEIVDVLLERGASTRAVNRRGASPLHYVCDLRPRSNRAWDPERQARIIHRLIEAGALIDLQDKGGVTPLHRAVRARGVAAVRALLKHGANVSVATHPGGSTPLHLAVTGSGAGNTANTKDEQLEIVSALLAHGADPFRPDARGRTPASAARSPEIRDALTHVR